MIGPITEPADLRAVAQLYSDVFGESLNHRLVVGLIRNGGHLLGAYRRGHLVGYGLSFPAVDEGNRYHYSQTVAVATEARGRGIGWAIKHAQRDVALREGAERLRWVFDPASTRNAHFNTDVVGARITRYYEDFYGEGTDRALVDWSLTSAPVRREWTVPDLAPGQAKHTEDGLALAAPVAAQAMRDALESGLVGVSCRNDVYLFAAP